MEENKTAQRDTDYGTRANLLYTQLRISADLCFKTKDISIEKSQNCLANLVDGIENQKIFFYIPYATDKDSVGYKASREAVEDAYLERGLPSPFPNHAPAKDTKKSIN